MPAKRCRPQQVDSGDPVQIACPVEQPLSFRMIAEGGTVVQDVVAEEAHARFETDLKNVRRIEIQQALQGDDSLL